MWHECRRGRRGTAGHGPSPRTDAPQRARTPISVGGKFWAVGHASPHIRPRCPSSSMTCREQPSPAQRQRTRLRFEADVPRAKLRVIRPKKPSGTPGTRQEAMNDRTPPTPRNTSGAPTSRAAMLSDASATSGSRRSAVWGGRDAAFRNGPALHPQTRRRSAARWPRSPQGGRLANGTRNKNSGCIYPGLPLGKLASAPSAQRQHAARRLGGG